MPVVQVFGAAATLGLGEGDFEDIGAGALSVEEEPGLGLNWLSISSAATVASIVI